MTIVEQICKDVGVTKDEVKSLACSVQRMLLATHISLGDAQELLADIGDALIGYTEALRARDSGVSTGEHDDARRSATIKTAESIIELVVEQHPGLRSNAVIVAALVANMLQERYLDGPTT